MIARTLMICGGLMCIATGCASRQPKYEPRADIAPQVDFDHAVTASALVFDAPAYADDLHADLSREPRERSAFVAYEEQTTTFSYVQLDDRQRASDRSWLRRAIIDRFSVTRR